MDNEKFYTISEAAEITRVSSAWWRQRVFQRKIRFIKMGARVLIPESTIKGLLQNGTVEPKANFIQADGNSF
jgi:excisionase family DNA binding protein